jgi:hypothetical protein
MQEAERRARQKELEVDKLKTKLSHIIGQEQHRKARNAEILDIICSNKGNVSIVREASNGFISVLLGKSKSKRDQMLVSSSSSTTIPLRTVLHLIDTCNEYQEKLLKRIAELESSSIGQSSLEIEESFASKLVSADIGNSSLHDDRGKSDADFEKDFEKLELIKEIEISNSENVHLNEKVEILQNSLVSHTQTIENLNLELLNRPTYKQFRELALENEILQQKLDDILALRDAASASSTWKSHLSTAEKIKIDKKNHELRLHLIDSLPTDIMRDTLKMICRELETPDISEIRPRLVKLKSAVRYVPRLQKFIETVQNYVISRNRTVEKELNCVFSYPMDKRKYEIEEDNQFNSILSILQRYVFDYF